MQYWPVWRVIASDRGVWKKIIIFSFAFLLLFKVSFADVSPAAGEKIFKSKCSSCHQPAPFEKKIVGPPLKGVTDKQTDEWLHKWIRNNATFRASGDKDAVAIWQEYGKNEMPTFTDFTDEDISSILAYIKNPPVAASAPGTTSNPNIPTSEQPSFWLYAVLGVLIVVAFLLMRTNTVLKRMAYEKINQPLPEEKPFWKRIKSRRALLWVIIIAVFAVGFMLTDSAIRLGHSKNYEPVQPINFPHSLHAGIAQIPCLYCHAGAEKSKVAGIPPVSTCMNCHKGIQEGQTEAGTAEIKKIYAYYDSNKPIQWVKIHNLPDHVYFNHSQHVVVGKIACQTCHGPVETMDHVYQYASLSMGWCINCHRQTDVQFKDNGYYTMYTQLHHDMEDGKIHEVTASMIGATECQKCHY